MKCYDTFTPFYNFRFSKYCYWIISSKVPKGISEKNGMNTLELLENYCRTTFFLFTTFDNSAWKNANKKQMFHGSF